MPTSTSLVDLANAGVRQLMQVAFAPDGEVVCEDGVFECGNPSYEKALRSDPDLPCTEYDGEYKEIEGKAWPLIVAAIVGAVMCFMIGANDSANSWGSSVGSKALPVGVAVVLGGIMEWLGALSLGYGVSSTIRKNWGIAEAFKKRADMWNHPTWVHSPLDCNSAAVNISDGKEWRKQGVAKPSDPECWACGYCNSRMGLYSIAMLSALIAAAIFMSITTFTAVPVSTTHAIVGGVVGSTIVAVGWDCLNWDWDGGLTGIIASWAISPLGSGMVGATAYLVLDYGLLRTPDARFSSFFWNPVLYFITTFIVLMLVLLKSKPTKKALERWEMSLISLGAGIAVAAIDVFFIMPIVKKHFPSVTAAKAKDAEKGGAEDTAHDGGEEGAEERVFDRVASVVGNNEIALHGFGDSKVLGEALEQRTKELAEESAGWSVEVKDAMYTFRPLLVFVAMVESFAHGANDTANSTSAVTAVWQMYDSGRRNCNIKETPVWLMAIAGGFVALGIITFGYRVIKTIGLNITSINFMKGFCIEFASTLSVVVFTVLEIPVSTTHCQVGAVVFVGLVSLGPKHVAWWLFGKIVLSWVLTLPFAGGIAAAFTAMLRPALKD